MDVRFDITWIELKRSIEGKQGPLRLTDHVIGEAEELVSVGKRSPTFDELFDQMD
jgi:hypothetical protein